MGGGKGDMPATCKVAARVHHSTTKNQSNQSNVQIKYAFNGVEISSVTFLC
jgi:hypothetical protein